MDELKKRLIPKLKVLKRIDNLQSDSILDFAVETAVYDILNYCNLDIEEFPEALDNTAVLISVDLLTEGGYLLSADEVSDGRVKSLTEGDFSISRETETEVLQKMLAAPSFSRKYTMQLNRFRKLAR